MRDGFWQKWDKGLVVGVIYAIAVLILGGTLNYVLPYSSGPETAPTAVIWLTWAALYISLALMIAAAGWQVSDFGIHVSRRMAFAGIAVIAAFGLLLRVYPISWQSAAIEAFARTGEEVFFRGLLYALLLRLFRTRKLPWLWAVVVSTILFTAVHTQTFQSSYLDSLGAMPTGYKIFDRLLNVFMIGLLIALLRYWSDSILPGALIHAGLQGGLLTIPFTLLIYGVLLAWAWLRKERNLFFEPPLET